MKTARLITQFGLRLTLVGLTSWNALPIHSGEAATGASLIVTGQPTPRAAANGRIAFVSIQGNGFETYTANPDGSDRMRLTFGQGDLDPAWSPDGTRLAFVRTYGFCNRGEIFVINTDGSDMTRLTEFGINRHPAWSPDGTKIAFVRVDECLDYFLSDRYLGGQLVVMNADGTNQKTIDTTECSLPVWSPNGSRLAFAHCGAIFQIRADGRHRVAVAGPEIGAYYYNPAWSPDGSKLAFVRETNCDINGCYSFNISTVNADGGDLATVADVYAFGLNWSPDGTKIVFSDESDLFVINADGSNVTNITNSPTEQEIHPSWQAFSFASCPDSLSAVSQSFNFNGGIGSIDVTATGECSWTAASNAPWISITSEGGVSGNGSVGYIVAANHSTALRAGILSIAASNFIVVQTGLPVIITSVSVVGKNLFVIGENFDPGALIFLNGSVQNTANDAQNPKAALIGRKTGKRIKPGDCVQVRNPNGSFSNEFTFTSSLSNRTSNTTP